MTTPPDRAARYDKIARATCEWAGLPPPPPPEPEVVSWDDVFGLRFQNLDEQTRPRSMSAREIPRKTSPLHPTRRASLSKLLPKFL